MWTEESNFASKLNHLNFVVTERAIKVGFTEVNGSNLENPKRMVEEVGRDRSGERSRGNYV